MKVCNIWPFAQISDDFYYLDIWQCGRCFVAALFKKFALITIITIREMWGLESRSRSGTSRSRSRSRLLWQSLGLCLVSKFEPGLGLGGYGLDYITAKNTACTDEPWVTKYEAVCFNKNVHWSVLWPALKPNWSSVVPRKGEMLDNI